jgi:hypothetical protein
VLSSVERRPFTAALMFRCGRAHIIEKARTEHTQSRPPFALTAPDVSEPSELRSFHTETGTSVQLTRRFRQTVNIDRFKLLYHKQYQ